MQKNITEQDLAAFESDFRADRANQIRMDAVMENGVLKSAKNRP